MSVYSRKCVVFNCETRQQGNKATRQRKRNPNRNQTNRDVMSRAESNRYGGYEKCPRADD